MKVQIVREKIQPLYCSFEVPAEIVRIDRRAIFVAENQVVFVTHGDDFETAQIIGKELLETYHVKEVVYSTMGPIIGAHTGANCLVIAFYATKR